jgi:hypothetical protein
MEGAVRKQEGRILFIARDRDTDLHVIDLAVGSLGK